MIELASSSPSQTREIAAVVATLCRPGDVIVLAGPMGAGKTAFAGGFAVGLGVGPEEPVASPTFTLVHTHESGRMPLHHADLYRLTSIGEVDDLGLRELADLGGVVLVEWGDAALDRLGEVLTVSIAPVPDPSDEVGSDDDAGDDQVRTLTISAVGHRWDGRWERLRAATARWGTR